MLASCKDFICEPLSLIKGEYYAEEMTEDDEDAYGCQAGDWAVFHSDHEFERSTWDNETYNTPLVCIITQWNHGDKTQSFAVEHANKLNKEEQQNALRQLALVAPCTPYAYLSESF